MAMDIDTYYDLLSVAQIEPLWNQLKEIDKPAALRFMLLWERVMCEDTHGLSYHKDGKYDELRFSRDLNTQKFEKYRTSIRVKPEKFHDFWETTERIIKQMLIFCKNTDLFSNDQKQKIFISFRLGVETRQFLENSFVEVANRLLPFINETIHQLQTTLNPSKGEALDGIDNKPGKTKLLTRERKKIETFESLFYDQTIVKELLKYLKNVDILDQAGNWDGTTNNASEFLALIDVLKSDGTRLIRFSSQRKVGRLFAEKFNIIISDRALSQHTNVRADSKETYKKVIGDFIEQRTKKD